MHTPSLLRNWIKIYQMWRRNRYAGSMKLRGMWPIEKQKSKESRRIRSLEKGLSKKKSIEKKMQQRASAKRKSKNAKWI
jgi:hypothetical protein